MFAATDGIAARSIDVLILVARLLIGWLFLTNGWAKLGSGMPGGITYFTGLGVPNGAFWIWPAMLAEVIIGVTLILGIATRYMSLFTVAY